MSKSIDILYSSPFPSTRTGALFNAFSYPTKISPEAEAIFIACHSNIGDMSLVQWDVCLVEPCARLNLLFSKSILKLF